MNLPDGRTIAVPSMKRTNVVYTVIGIVVRNLQDLEKGIRGWLQVEYTNTDSGKTYVLDYDKCCWRDEGNIQQKLKTTYLHQNIIKDSIMKIIRPRSVAVELLQYYTESGNKEKKLMEEMIKVLCGDELPTELKKVN